MQQQHYSYGIKETFNELGRFTSKIDDEQRKQIEQIREYLLILMHESEKLSIDLIVYDRFFDLYGEKLYNFLAQASIVGGITIAPTNYWNKIASLMELTNEDKYSIKCDDVVISFHSTLLIPPYLLERSSIVSETLDKLSQIVPIRYDDRQHPGMIVKADNDKIYYQMQYIGPVPQKIFDGIVKEQFMRIIDDVWKTSLFSAMQEHKTKKRFKNLLHAKRLGNAMMLDYGKLNIPYGGKTGKQLDGLLYDMSTNDLITVTDLTAEQEEIMQSLKTFKDICALWKTAHDDTPFSVCLSKDILSDEEKLNKVMRKFAELIDFDVYYEAYASGIPVEDISV